MEVAPDDPRSHREGGSLERADLVGQVCGSSPHGPTISSLANASRLSPSEADVILISMSDLVASSPDVLAASSSDSRRQLEALLEVNEAIAQHRDLQALFRDLRERLRTVVQFDFLALVLHDAARNVMRLHVLEAHRPTEKVAGTELPVEGTPSGW